MSAIFVANLSTDQYIARMHEKLKQQVLDAFQLVLRPIVKILLRFGVGVSEFTELVKKSYVDVASTEYGIRGRLTNISRVAVMTGLTRKEVRRLRNAIESGDTSLAVKTTPIAEILHRWHAESDFLDEKGRPAALPFSGDGHSFSELVKRFGGDVPPGAMRTELKRVGSVVESDDGRLSITRRSAVPTDKTDNLVTSLIHSVYPLLCTVVDNSDPEEAAREPKQLTAYSTKIRKGDLGRLRRVSSDRLADVAETFDDLFMAYETLNDKSGDEQGTTVAVGLFYFEEHDENAKYTW